MTTEICPQALIRRFLAENFLFSDEGFTMDDDASLLDAGVIDSTGVLELVMFVEETFGFHVDDPEVIPENFDSVSRIAQYVVAKLEAQPTISEVA